MTLCSRQNLFLERKKIKTVFCYLDLSSLFIWFIHRFTLVTARGNSEKSCPATGNHRSEGVSCACILWGPLLLLLWKNLKEFLSIKERSKRSQACEWAEDISPKESVKHHEGSFGLKGHPGIKNRISSNLLRTFCFIYFLSVLFVIIWSKKKRLFSGYFFFFYWLVYLVFI